MSNLSKAAAVVLLLSAGCIVAYDEPPRRYDSSSQAEATVEQAPEVEEVDYVVYREYFGCSEAEIAYFPHYRRYYGLSDDDIYFIYYTSFLCGVTFDVCFHTYYYDCGRNYDRLVVYYRVPRERYFVAIGPGVSPPPIYARTYASYRSGSTASVTFTNQEYVALVHLKVGVEGRRRGRPAGYSSRAATRAVAAAGPPPAGKSPRRRLAPGRCRRSRSSSGTRSARPAPPGPKPPSRKGTRNRS